MTRQEEGGNSKQMATSKTRKQDHRRLRRMMAGIGGALAILLTVLVMHVVVEACDCSAPSILATATAWVRSDDPSTTNCNDSTQHVRVERNGKKLRRTYLYFEDIPGAADAVKLWIDTTREGGRVAVYTAAWAGECIDWDSQPGLGALIDSKNVSGGLVDFDITYAAAGGGSLALVLAMENEGATAHIDFTCPCVEVTYLLEAIDDADETDEDTAVTTDVLSNDSLGHQPTQITTLTNGAHGATQGNGDGTVTYTPDPDFNGIDTFTYTIEDSNGNSDSAVVSITVYPTNDEPTALDDLSETDENQPVQIDILTNDSDPDGSINPASLSIIQDPSHGTVNVDPSTGVVTYTPANGECGSDVFSYSVEDNEGAVSNEATVSIDVRCNQPPIANDDSATTDENTSIEVDVASNDDDPDGSLDTSSIKITRPPSFGTINVHPTSGLVTYMPDPLSCGDDSFSYTIADDDGELSDEATVMIAVLCDDPPLAIDDLYHVSEGESLDVNPPGILDNDITTPDDPLTATLVSDVSHGVLTLNADGSFVYVHDGSETTSDQFTYFASDDAKDSNLATVSLIIHPVNDVPAAVDDEDSTSEDIPVTIDVLINDSDPDGDPLSVDWVEQPENGSVAYNGGNVTYTPGPNFHGTDTFSYAVTDGSGGQAEAMVTVLVSPVNDPPMAQDDSDSTDEGTSVVIDVLPNDFDPDGDNLTVQSVTQPDSGSVVNDGLDVVYTPDPEFNGIDSFTYTVSDGNGETAIATVTVAVAAVNDPPVAEDDVVITGEDAPVTILVLPNDSDPDSDVLSVESTSQPHHGTVISNGTSIIYTPDPNYVGMDSFTYTISDGKGETSTAVVSIEVLPVNDPPIAQDDSQTTQEDTPVTVLVLSNDSDPDDDPLRIESITPPSNGIVVNNGLALVYEPDPEYSGPDSFTYTVSDNRGGTDTARVTILIDALNDPPIAQNDSADTDEETLVSIPILANDSDPDGDFLLIESFTQPRNGSVLNSRTTLSYIPDPGFQGIDNFTYTVSDGNGGSSQATVTISVAEVNDPPIAQDDSSITDEGTPITILSLLNDSDPDGDPLEIESVTSPDNGVVEIVGEELLYTPDPGFDGVDIVTYTISDGRGGTSTATVFIAVVSINDAPIAQDDSMTTIKEENLFVPVLTNDSDPDGDPLVILSVTQPVNGSVTIEGSDLLYEPDDGFIGTDLFEYTIADDSGSTSTATVTIGVDPLITGAGGADSGFASCDGRAILSEIAWAGTAADSRDEWIELRNLGTTPIDLTGWVLRWRRTHPSTPAEQVWKVVELSGILSSADEAACNQSAQDDTARIQIEKLEEASWLVSSESDVSGSGYYVLERRHNDTVQDIPAGQIYDTDRTLILELSDLGEIIMLVNEHGEVVDTANASNLGRNGWVAGSAATRGSMERIDPLRSDTVDNWQTNFGLVIAGEDADGHPLRATPGIVNSPNLEIIDSIASIPSTTVRAGDVLQTDFPLSRQDRLAAGWPWISVIRPGFAGISGAGGSIDYSAYSFSGSYQSDSQYALEIATSDLSTGSYLFWIIYNSGKAVYLPVIVSQ